MLNIFFVFLGGFILAVSLSVSLWLVRSIKGDSVMERWVILQVVLFVIGIFYGLFLLEFLNFGITAFISIELLASLTLMLVSIYVAGASYLTWKTLRGIYGTDMSDKRAMNKFLRFANLSASAGDILMNKSFDLNCEVCEKQIEYTIQDVVRSHPDLERGIEIEDGLGETNFTFYVRHDCTDHYRETPIQHDHNMVPRSQKDSREVVKI